jgi:arabinofuranan 3-O-arabinosyltransferase
MTDEASLIRKTAEIWAVAAGVYYCYDILRDTGQSLTTSGRPLGDDFVNYWSGAFLAWHGRAADIYNWPAYHAFQQGVVGVDVGPYNYSYSPILLVLTAPLALLAYVPGLAAWVAASWFAFYRALRLALPGRDAILLAFATPAVFVNAYGGQNGTWTAALLGGGLCLLERRPVLAGMMFGLLTFKPHLGLLIPVALLAGRRWHALFAATATAAALVLLSVALFGADAWADYLRHASILRTMAIEDGSGVWHRTISLFMFVRRLGADVPTAYLVQIVAGLMAAAVVAVAWFRDAPLPVRGTLLVLGTFLATPYLQDYDMVVGAFVAVWLVSASDLAHVPRRLAVAAAASILIVPLVASPIANAAGLALGALFLIPAFVLMARLAFGERENVRIAT